MPGIVRLGDVCSGHGCWPSRPNDEASSNVFVNSIGVHRLGDHWITHCFVGETRIFINNEKMELDVLFNIFSTSSIFITKSFYNNEIIDTCISKILKFKTKKILEMVLENGYKIRCTPEHLFLLKSGIYKKAIDLTLNDELMHY